MKKFYPYLILMILLLAFSGCDLVDSEMDNDEDTSGATLSPMTNAEVLSLYMQVDDALYAAFNTNGESLPNETSDSGSNNGVSTSIETDRETLEWLGTYGGGNVDIKGIFTDILTEPDVDATLAQNTVYDDLYKYISTTLISKASAADEAGTVENVTLTINSIDYTVSAEITVDSSLEYTIDVDTTDDPITYTGGYSFSTDFDFSTTVEREDGSGTAMTIQYSSGDAGPIEGNDIELTGFSYESGDSYESQDYDPVIDELEGRLADVPVSIAVRNFDAEEINTSPDYFTLTLGEFLNATAE